jgi:hypothetical protein
MSFVLISELNFPFLHLLCYAFFTIFGIRVHTFSREAMEMERKSEEKTSSFVKIKGEKDSFSTTFYYASDLEAIKQTINTIAVIYLFNLIRNH